MMTELQLQVWTELVYEKIELAQKIDNETDVLQNPYKSGLARGEINGLAQALTLFSIVEDGKRMKKHIEEIEKKLQ